MGVEPNLQEEFNDEREEDQSPTPFRVSSQQGSSWQQRGGIYQRESDGLWCASVSVELGKRKVLYGKTREEVGSKLVSALNDVKNGMTLPSYRVTLGAFLEQWLADVVWQRNRPSTAHGYEFYVRKYIIPRLADTRSESSRLSRSSTS